jgi:hypothetical protein
MNCHEEVAGEAKFFAEVFVCPDCFLVASRFYERAQQEAKQMLVLMKEYIRLSLVTGKLQFQTPEQVEKADGPALIEHIADLARKAKKEQECQTQEDPTSTDDTPPHVKTLAAVGRASSTSHNPADSK